MKYVVVKTEDGAEHPVVFGKGLDVSKITFPGTIIAAGEADVKSMFITCQGTMTINDKQYVSRGLKDEILLRSSDFM